MSPKKLYYQLTAYLPRRLPTSEKEFLAFRDILFQYYDIPDEPQTYHVMSGQIQSTPGHKIRKSYGTIANNIKRLKINALAQCYRIAAEQEFKARLEQKLKEEAEKEQTPTQGLSDGKPVSDQGVSTPAPKE